MKHFETELPAGYREAFTVDAADKKIGIVLNLVAALVMIALAAAAALIIRPRDLLGNLSISRNLITLGLMFVYLVLHELTHGAAYKILTKQTIFIKCNKS